VPQSVPCRAFSASLEDVTLENDEFTLETGTCGVCDVHASAMRRLPLQNCRVIVLWKTWRCGGDAHVQMHRSICVYLRKHVFYIHLN